MFDVGSVVRSHAELVFSSQLSLPLFICTTRSVSAPARDRYMVCKVGHGIPCIWPRAV
jgi:hypothetical protein